jgi:hypothetical protein
VHPGLICQTAFLREQVVFGDEGASELAPNDLMHRLGWRRHSGRRLRTDEKANGFASCHNSPALADVLFAELAERAMHVPRAFIGDRDVEHARLEQELV